MLACPVCGGIEFSNREVIWQELSQDWQLSPHELAYINRQQGYICVTCANNLRSMSLASAILTAYSFSGTLLQFVESDIGKQLRVLEINEAGNLTSVLNRMPNHTLVHYPEHDMTSLVFKSESFDLVLHSDTLEHVQNPLAGLAECCRVIKKPGRCIFTVPIVLGRLTHSREGMKQSFHGSYSTNYSNMLVCTEYGADVWKYVIESGFTQVSLHCLEYPAGIAIESIKN